MNLLDIASKGRTYKKAGNTHGGEWQGPCPLCGGTDRFHIWPQQGDYGTYWCRSCDKAGDAIQYLMDIEGLSFRDAAKTVGKEITDHAEYQAPAFRRPATAEEPYTPRETVPAADLWIEHATKLADWAHEQLLNSPDQLAWLATRGLDRQEVITYGLGWNPGDKGKDLYRVREAWGLPTLLKDDQKTRKKLWLPIGLIIPYRINGILQRLRIRRPEGDPRYYLVPGSNTAPMMLPSAPPFYPAQGTLKVSRRLSGAEAYVIVESELDALLIHHCAGDLVGVMSQGNSTAKPDAAAATALADALAILVSLDSDEPGMQAAIWWRQQFPQAERWPVPVGKDPGEAYQAGTDIRAWVKTGLPPVFSVSPVPGCVATVPAPVAPSAEEMERRAAMVAALYAALDQQRPPGSSEWLHAQRSDIIDQIDVVRKSLEAAIETGPDGEFGKLHDKMLAWVRRSWQVFADHMSAAENHTPAEQFGLF